VATILHERGMVALQRLIRPTAIAAALAGAALVIFFLYMKGLWAGHWFIRTFGLSMLVGIFASILIIAVAAPSSILARSLTSPALRFFGKYSYGMYVIHALMMSALLALMPTEKWMNFFGNQIMLGSLSLAFAKIAICTVLAIASFHFYEMPFLRLKRYFEPAPSRLAPPEGTAIRI
jgi:peptidoglycan/LPS O-acetylase OafA/YrhL